MQGTFLFIFARLTLQQAAENALAIHLFSVYHEQWDCQDSEFGH